MSIMSIEHAVNRTSNDCRLKIDVMKTKTRAGQVRKLVRKSANQQLRTNEKSCGQADSRTLAV